MLIAVHLDRPESCNIRWGEKSGDNGEERVFIRFCCVFNDLFTVDDVMLWDSRVTNKHKVPHAPNKGSLTRRSFGFTMELPNVGVPLGVRFTWKGHV
ncbi:hypothetical protein GOBAR_DD04940 [Gossypium barbadense]|nr:hypothetical protein GOBAR_DD04940 [Gossypium barbadense]